MIFLILKWKNYVLLENQENEDKNELQQFTISECMSDFC
jgi:hypothetical protein